MIPSEPAAADSEPFSVRRRRRAAGQAVAPRRAAAHSTPKSRCRTRRSALAMEEVKRGLVYYDVPAREAAADGEGRA